MRRIALLPALLGGFLLIPLTGSAASGTQPRDLGPAGRAGTVWVVNRDKGEVTVFDAKSGLPLATRPAGAGAHEVAISNDVDKAYITNENENTVSILSTRTLAGSKIALGPRPHHAEPSQDGETILVGLVGTNVVAAIDAETAQVTRYTSSANTAATAHGPFLRNETIYVAHEIGDEVTGIARDTGAIEFSVGGISQPTEVLPDRHERVLYVSARGEGKIKVIDLDTRTVVDEVAVGTQPETMLLTRDRRTLIVSMRGTPARLAFVDTRDLVLTAHDRPGWIRDVRRPRRDVEGRPRGLRHLRSRDDGRRRRRRRRCQAPYGHRHVGLPRGRSDPRSGLLSGPAAAPNRYRLDDRRERQARSRRWSQANRLSTLRVICSMSGSAPRP